MRFVEKAAINPGRCAVLPALGGAHPAGYVDTASELQGGGNGQWDQHVYVSIIACRELATFIGWVDPAELTAQLADAEARLAESEADLASANRQLDAIDVMESADFRARRKPGRPSKQHEMAEA